jgi:hypothetical protein
MLSARLRQMGNWGFSGWRARSWREAGRSSGRRRLARRAIDRIDIDGENAAATGTARWRLKRSSAARPECCVTQAGGGSLGRAWQDTCCCSWLATVAERKRARERGGALPI